MSDNGVTAANDKTSGKDSKMLDIMTDNWDHVPDINDSERMLRLTTRDRRPLYVIVDKDISDERVNMEIRFTLTKKVGKSEMRHGYYMGFEDVTYLCKCRKLAQEDAKRAWEHEGWYHLWWSDSKESITEESPVWFDCVEDLADAIEAAYASSTGTCLPCVERVELTRFQDYELEGLLGDSVGDFDYERLVDAITRWIDGDRYYTQEWLHMEADEIPGFLQQFEK